MGRVLLAVFVVYILYDVVASMGCASLAWTHWHKSSNSLVMSVNLAGLLGSDSLKSLVFTMMMNTMPLL